jgi:hypothetical protein
MSRLITTALVGVLALSAAGCAIELPKSAIGAFRLAPPDAAQKTDAPERQDLKHVSTD